MGTSVAPVAPAVVETAPAAPAAVPVAPVVPAPQSRADILRGLVTPKETAPTDGVPVPTADATPKVDAIPEADAAPSVETPVVETAPEPVSDGLKYRKRNAAGEYITPDNTAKIEFEIGGKTYSKTEAELVRGFPRSVEASRIQNENRDLRERHIPEIQQRFESQLSEVRTNFQDQATINIQVLEAARLALRNGDTSQLEHVVGEWEQLNAPEAQLQRERAERAEERRQRETETNVNRMLQLTTHLHGEVVKPAYDALIKDHADAFGGADALLDLMRGRLVGFRSSLQGPPEQRAQAITVFVRGPLTQWVTETATRIRGQSSAALAAKETAELEAQRAKQIARQAESRGLVPVGQTPSGLLSAPRSAPLTREQIVANLRSGPR